MTKHLDARTDQVVPTAQLLATGRRRQGLRDLIVGGVATGIGAAIGVAMIATLTDAEHGWYYLFVSGAIVPGVLRMGRGVIRLVG